MGNRSNFQKSGVPSAVDTLKSRFIIKSQHHTCITKPQHHLQMTAPQLQCRWKWKIRHTNHVRNSPRRIEKTPPLHDYFQVGAMTQNHLHVCPSSGFQPILVGIFCPKHLPTAAARIYITAQQQCLCFYFRDLPSSSLVTTPATNIAGRAVQPCDKIINFLFIFSGAWG